MFADYWIPKEAAYVRQLQIEELQNHFNLTLVRSRFYLGEAIGLRSPCYNRLLRAWC